MRQKLIEFPAQIPPFLERAAARRFLVNADFLPGVSADSTSVIAKDDRHRSGIGYQRQHNA
jgi:hypothetical protein